MTTHGQHDSTQAAVIDLHTVSDRRGKPLDDYLLESTHKLDALAELASQGEAIDSDAHSWMLAQVDFIIDTIGDESLELSDEARSNLLQLLLSVANLNEHIRHQASLNR